MMNRSTCGRGAYLGVLALMILFGGTLQAQDKALPSNELNLEQYPIYKQDRVSTHYLMPDGTIRAVFTVKPHNYQLPDGSWAKIEERVEPGEEFAWESRESGLISLFPHLSDDGVVFKGQAHAGLSMRPGDMVAYDESGNIIANIEPRTANVRQDNERTVHYPGLYPGAVDEYVVGPDMVKHNLMLDRAAINGFETSTSFGAQFVITLPEGYTVLPAEDGRTLHLVNQHGETVYGLGPVDAFDAGHGFTNGFLESDLAGRELTVTMRINTAWALDPDRVWPISIDPTLDLQPDATAGKDTYVRQTASTTNYGTRNTLGANYSGDVNPLHVLVEFDISSIGSAASVTSAQYEMYHRSNTVTNEVFTITEITQSWSESTVTWSTRPTIAASATTSLTYVNGSSGRWRTWTGLGNLTQTWVSGTSTNNGLYIINTTQDKFYAYHHSSDYTTDPTLRPKYQVIYTNSPPSVSGISPDPVDWLGTLTITGTNLDNATSVTVGGVAAAITSNTSTQIEATVADTTPTGSQTVSVTTPSGTDNGQSVTVNDVAPTVTSASPNPVNWLATLTITGNYLSSTSAVTVGGVAATITSTGTTSVDVTVSDSTPTGSQTISLTTSAGTDTSTSVTVNGVAPSVTGASPDPVDWLDNLTITGNYLAQASSVTIGGEAAAIQSASTTQVVVTVADTTPTGNQTISITTPGGTDNSQSVTVNGVAPTATSASPDPVTWGQTLTITGNYLGGTSGVTIGGVAQTLGTISTTSVELTVDVATPTGSQTIVITTPGGTDNSLSVTVDSLAPTVSSVSPDPVTWTQSLTITGNYLANATVTIGGVAQTLTSNTVTQIELDVDYSTPTGNQTVEVTTPGGSDSSQSVTVNALAPSITSVSPNPVQWQQTLTINGDGLGSATNVEVGGVTLTPTANTNTLISVVIPVTMPTGSQTVEVTTAHGTDATSVTVNGVPPITNAVSPGSVLAGGNITISGNFLDNATVTVGGVAASVQSNSTTQIDVQLGSGTPTGTQTIQVTTPWGSTSNLSVEVTTQFSSSGGGGGGGGGGCVVKSGDANLWLLLLLGVIATAGFAARRRGKA